MDWVAVKNRLLDTVKKHRYAIIVVLVGVLLMWIPVGGEKETQPPAQTKPAENSETVDPAEELERVLSQIKGVGQVKVLLTQSRGEEILYQWNENITTQDNSESSRRDTVVVTDSNRQQNGLVRQVNPPIYQGAVVVCQGADNVEVCLSVVKAVKSVTGLGTDRICVLKMK